VCVKNSNHIPSLFVNTLTNPNLLNVSTTPIKLQIL